MKLTCADDTGFQTWHDLCNPFADDMMKEAVMGISLVNAFNANMDYYAARQAVISGNIANASTPGYIARDLQFSAKLDNANVALAQTQAGHFSSAPSSSRWNMTLDTSGMKHDGNSVELDAEMLKLNETQMNYRVMTELYAKNVQLQKLAISGK